MWPNPQETADLVTFTEEILNGELHFSSSITVLQVLSIYQSCFRFLTRLLSLSTLILVVFLPKGKLSFFHTYFVSSQSSSSLWNFFLNFSYTYRSSHLEVFCKKVVLRNFAKFTKKHLCQSLFFNKIARLVCKIIKKKTLAEVFSCEFCEISKKTLFTEHLRANASEHSHHSH